MVKLKYKEKCFIVFSQQLSFPILILVGLIASLIEQSELVNDLIVNSGAFTTLMLSHTSVTSVVPTIGFY
jgi:hypothetical protein